MNNKNGIKSVKKCKYCQSEIDINAKVCPNCSRDQRMGNNPIWLIPIAVVITIILYCILSSNAPLKVRKVVCSIGIRSGYPYCYYYEWEDE